MGEPRLLPAGACLLHIGPYKTGSTAIQSAMHNARDRLGEHGVRYAGRGTRDRRAGWAVMERDPRGRDKPKIEEWHALVAEVREASDMRVCVSNEDFARLAPKYVERIAGDLGRDRLHVLAVARRFDRLLPSQWQERVKCHETLTYEEFLREVLDDDSDHHVHRAFWASHGVEGMAERWGSLVGNENFSVVVSDDMDRTLLLRTFERMLGLPEDFLELDSKSNPSLPANGVEFVRRLNEAFDADDSLTDAAYFHLIQRGAIPRMKYAPRSESDEPIPPLPVWATERIAELSERRVDTLRELGVQVVGDPTVLLTKPDTDVTAFPDPPAVVSIDTAVKAVEGVVEAALKQQRKARRVAKKAAPGRRGAGAKRRGAGAGRGRRRTSASAAGRATGGRGTGGRAAAGPRVEDLSGRELLRVVASRAKARLRRTVSKQPPNRE